MFAEAGLVQPTGDWDWKAFAQTAKKLTKHDGDRIVTYGFQQYPSFLWYFPWCVQSGVDFSDPAVVPLGSTEAIRAFEFLYEWVEQEVFCWGWEAPFKGQQSAMTFSGSWELNYWIGTEFPMGVTQVPTGPAGKATFTNTDIWAINSQTKHPDAAWQFLKWMYSEEVQRQFLNLFGLQPARLSMGYDWVDAEKDIHSRHRSLDVTGLESFITSSAFAMPQPVFVDDAVIDQYIQPAIDQIMSGSKPVGPTLKSMSEAATAILQNRLLP